MWLFKQLWWTLGPEGTYLHGVKFQLDVWKHVFTPGCPHHEARHQKQWDPWAESLDTQRLDYALRTEESCCPLSLPNSAGKICVSISVHIDTHTFPEKTKPKQESVVFIRFTKSSLQSKQGSYTCLQVTHWHMGPTGNTRNSSPAQSHPMWCSGLFC